MLQASQPVCGIMPFAQAKTLALQEDCRVLLHEEQRYVEQLRVFKQQMLDSPERQKLDEQYMLQRKDLCQIMVRTSERYDLGWRAAHLGMSLLHAYMATEHSTGTNIELAAIALFAIAIEKLAKCTTPVLKLSELTDDWNDCASQEHTVSLGGGPAELRLPWKARAHAIAAKQVETCNALQWRLFGATADVFLKVFTALPMSDATDKRMIFIDETEELRARLEETSVTEADWKEVRVIAKLFCRLGFLHNMNTLYGESALAAASLQAGREHQGIEPPWTDALTLRYHVRDVHAMQRCVEALTRLASRHQPLVDWPVWRQHEPEF